ncbi:alpha/beta fold hydrolase [Catenulispora sp. NF23]|uniref:thioesterase domain-containing protein n=1 Tax=Catenulispora pinistramenti TaxID=2705254 RepID=UPI001BAC34CA|nr:non-ribosomal peptide synthetase [Catenulispora pinistramenti]MBS2532039.1 alpha/beta fold hydrolase [Catenulispora pinistramenti]
MTASASDHRQRPTAAPRDRIEVELLRLYEELLQTAPIGIDECFFDLGGHSLLAVQLLARIKKTLGVTIPLAWLFEQTVEEDQPVDVAYVRTLLHRAEATPDLSDSVLLREAEGVPSVFFISGAGGDVTPLFPLARALRADRRCVGLQAPPLRPGEDEQAVETLAEHHVRQIQRLVPHGPYALIGWSMGGATAFEVASRLQAAGEKVELLALLDSFLGDQLPDYTEAEIVAMYTDELIRIHRADPADSTDSEALAAELPYSAGLERVLQEAVVRGLIPMESDLGYFRERFAMYRAHVRALGRYKPVDPVEQLALIYAGGPEDQVRAQAAACWSELSEQPATVRFVDGDHYSMLREPAVAHVAAVVGDWLPDAGR